MQNVARTSAKVALPRQLSASQVKLSTSRPAAISCRQPLTVRADSPLELSSGFKTRPYTIRKGDYLYSIAKKRGITINQIKALNPGLDVANQDYMVPGETILLPAGKLSERDLEILAGIGSGKTRIYPVRKGETIEAIASNRGIPMKQIEKLNPDIDLQALVGGEKISLPAGYYTVREKEVLSTVMPSEALAPPGQQRMSVLFPIGLFLVLIAAGGVAFRSERFRKKLKSIKRRLKRN